MSNLKRMTEIDHLNLIEGKKIDIMSMMIKKEIKEDRMTVIVIENEIVEESQKKTPLIEIEIETVEIREKDLLREKKEGMIAVEEKEVARGNVLRNKMIKRGDKISERREILLIEEIEIDLLKRNLLMKESVTESLIIIVTGKMINKKRNLLSKLQNLKTLICVMS